MCKPVQKVKNRNVKIYAFSKTMYGLQVYFTKENYKYLFINHYFSYFITKIQYWQYMCTLTFDIFKEENNTESEIK